MSRALERKYYRRWSETILRRKDQLNFTKTSNDDNISSVKISQSTSSEYHDLNEIKTKTNNNILSGGDMRCVNHEFAIRKRLSKSTKIFSNVNGDIQHLRESIELQLINGQVNESLADDRQTKLIQHLNLITSTLDALIHHIQSLQLSHLSCCRIFKLGQQFARLSSMSDKSSKSDRNKISQQLKDILIICTTNISTRNDQIQLLIDDYTMRHNDFSLAIKNFKCLLNNPRINYNQLEKLYEQYDSILQKYQHKRHAVNLELSKIIQGLESLQEGLQLINIFYNNHEYWKKTGSVFKLISDCLSGNDLIDDNIMGSKTQQQTTEKICQKLPHTTPNCRPMDGTDRDNTVVAGQYRAAVGSSALPFAFDSTKRSTTFQKGDWMVL
ncbi:hypothetical protein PV328_006544 [Microctonus aethiopoides]|uniref:Uncharacterized protein n=1 Tax=Microctonus aethiopoides TaxID=144406 RepID=A0AA39FQ62_9HYME|nr:hypothetical protein PV328_006544 [Microctonus aethiopoides]